MSLIGRPYPFVALDQSWTLSRFSYTVWEELVEKARKVIPDPRQEVAEILKTCPELPTEEKVKMVREANAKYATMFDIGSEAMVEWIKTYQGVIHFVLTLLKKNHPEVTVDTVVDIINSGELDVDKAFQTVSGQLPPKDTSPGG